jgi:5-methylcytosine-specific restriction endonuclease McrA
MEYNEYLKSAHWYNTKEEALKRSCRKCEICQNESELHVHHLTYKNIGYEKREDLIVLCEPCHTKEHKHPFVVGFMARRKEQLQAV